MVPESSLSLGKVAAKKVLSLFLFVEFGIICDSAGRMALKQGRARSPCYYQQFHIVPCI